MNNELHASAFGLFKGQDHLNLFAFFDVIWVPGDEAKKIAARWKKEPEPGSFS